MCGIVGGFWRNHQVDVEAPLHLALDRLRHRGPNDSGSVVARDSSYCVALGQTRLSIIDLSSGGHQPMLSTDGSLALVLNGEIYNYRELRQELVAAGWSFRSESDTEVLLVAWQHWGRACLPRLEGMFAFVVHDRRQQRLTLVRDAFGIKPFFYEQDEHGLRFASEQQALSALTGRPQLPDLQRAYDYLVHGDYDSEERTFIRDVRHLLPGTLLDVDLGSPGRTEPVVWWRASSAQAFHGSFADAAEAVREQFLHNIRLHLRSDVPLGATLSGGIDSSAVVCAIRHVEPDIPIHTFSFVAEGSGVSEENWVDVANQAVGASPNKIRATTDDLLKDLDTIISIQGEPFGSTSICAQYRVFQLARAQGITVTLDGQGADELLAGYSGFPGLRMLSLLENGRYRDAHRFARRWGSWPGRSYGHAWLRLGQALLPDAVYGTARRALGRDFRPPWLKIGLLREMGVHFGEVRPHLELEHKGRRVAEGLANGLQSRGLPKLLRHGDRNAMAFSIESRVPFLTVPMANLLLSMPEDYLISNAGETKHVFRAAMRGIVPDAILDRRDKIGFATPERDWLLGAAPVMRQWLESGREVPFLDQRQLLGAFDRIVASKRALTRPIWRWVNYVRWYGLQSFDGAIG
jgi:asparagine synthase (glutamine-hydrolysing)